MAALFHFSSEDFCVPPISARFSSWLDWSDTASAVCIFTLPENEPETAGMIYLLDSGLPFFYGCPSDGSIHPSRRVWAFGPTTRLKFSSGYVACTRITTILVRSKTVAPGSDSEWPPY